MVSAGKVEVFIDADSSGLERGLRRAGAVAAQAAAAIGAAMAVGIGLAIREAANAEEISSKFDAVFRDSADSVREWARVTADATARSSIAFEQYLSAFQDTFVPLGLARDEAAAFSQTLTQLAVDLASFNNESEPETVRALQSALVGNHETVRRYGVIINEAGIEQELLNMGILGGKDAATAAQVAMARLNIIMAGTADAQGDAARTSDSLTNQTRAFQAELRDTAVAIGEAFMPAARDMLQWARDMLPAVEDVGVALGNLASGASGGVAGELGPEGAAVAARDAFKAAQDELRRLERQDRAETSRGGSFIGRLLGENPEGTIQEARRQVEVTRRLLEEANRLRDVFRGTIPGRGEGGVIPRQRPHRGISDTEEAAKAERRHEVAIIEKNEALQASAQAAADNARAFAGYLDAMQEATDAERANAAANIEATKLKAEAMAESLNRFRIDATQAGEMVTGAIGGAFDKMARGVKVTFRDLAQEIMAIFARIAFNNLIAGPVSQFASNLFGGGGGGIGGAIAGALGTTATAAAVAPSAKGGASSQTIINIDAKYASQGTAEMIVAKIQEAAPALIQQSSNVAVQTMNQTQRARSAF